MFAAPAVACLPESKPDLVIVDEATLIPSEIEAALRRVWHLPAHPPIDAGGEQMIADLDRLDRVIVLNPEVRVLVEPWWRPDRRTWGEP